MLIVFTMLSWTLSASQISAQDTTIRLLSIAIDLEEEKFYRKEIAEAFEKANPGISVQWDYIENEAFKAKLPTLMQSDARPDIFFSFGGGIYFEQAKAGILQDISNVASGECKAAHSEAGLDAFSRNGALNGLPMYAAEVVMWYNKTLAAKVGIDVEAISNWDDFLTAVQSAKTVGVTPIIAGGKDKWPLHFYYSMLAVRMLGKDAIQNASQGLDGGYANEGWVKVGEQFKRLVDLEPFQPGFLDAGYEKAALLFGEGQGLFHLMGNWDYNTSRAQSSSGEGIGDENLGMVSFPKFDGGGGGDNDTFGGINGWLVTKNASPKAVEFLCFLVNQQNQYKAGELGFWIPVAKNSSGGIKNPFFAQVSKNLAGSSYHQLFLDQALGSSVGATINDVSADLAAGFITPKEAADRIEEARQFQ